MGAAQLVCLILGVLFVSLGGGMLGGRLIAQKSGEESVSRSADAAQNLDTAGPAESPSPLPWSGAEPHAEMTDTSATGATESAESTPGQTVVPAESSTIDAASVVLPAEEPNASLQETVPIAQRPAPEPETKYVIQAVSTASRSDAVAARKRIMTEGFSAGIFEADIPGKGTWYRVYIGPYDDEAAARAALKTIRDIPGFAESFLKTLE